MVMTENQIYRTVLKGYPDILDVKQLCAILDVSKKTAYKLIKDGEIASMKVGREYRIPKISLMRYFLRVSAAYDVHDGLSAFGDKIKVQHV